jgi:hypothetical protein
VLSCAADAFVEYLTRWCAARTCFELKVSYRQQQGVLCSLYTLVCLSMSVADLPCWLLWMGSSSAVSGVCQVSFNAVLCLSIRCTQHHTAQPLLGIRHLAIFVYWLQG